MPEDKVNLTPANFNSQAPRPYGVSAFHVTEQQNVGNFMTPDKRKQGSHGVLNGTEIATRTMPVENCLTRLTPIQPINNERSCERAPTPTGEGTFIQNITNNIIHSNENTQPPAQKISDVSNQLQIKEKRSSMPSQGNQCNGCCMGKGCPPSQFPPMPMNPYMMPPHPMYMYPPPYGFNPYMQQYGMPPNPYWQGAPAHRPSMEPPKSPNEKKPVSQGPSHTKKPDARFENSSHRYQNFIE